jgi:Ca2+-binding RTX toxin-like protein
VGGDVIKLKHTVFAAIATGVLSADAFHTGPAAADAEDRIIYQKSTGNLYYDNDGTGAHAKVLFATIEKDATPRTRFSSRDGSSYQRTQQTRRRRDRGC